MFAAPEEFRRGGSPGEPEIASECAEGSWADALRHGVHRGECCRCSVISVNDPGQPEHQREQSPRNHVIINRFLQMNLSSLLLEPIPKIERVMRSSVTKRGAVQRCLTRATSKWSLCLALAGVLKAAPVRPGDEVKR